MYVPIFTVVHYLLDEVLCLVQCEAHLVAGMHKTKLYPTKQMEEGTKGARDERRRRGKRERGGLNEVLSTSNWCEKTNCYQSKH